MGSSATVCPMGGQVHRLLAGALGHALAFDPQLVIITQEVKGLVIGILQEQRGAQGPALGGGLVDLEALIGDLGGLNFPPGHLLQLLHPAAAEADQRQQYRQAAETGLESERITPLINWGHGSGSCQVSFI